MLNEDSIEVWSLQLDAKQWRPEQVARWRGLLSDEELRRGDAFRTEEHRLDYIASHAALRFLLAEALDVQPRELRFVSDSSRSAAGGGGSRIKPALLQTSEGAHENLLRFNLSHTRGAALICLSRGREVGVDIEFRRPMDDLESMARAVMSNVEFEFWSRFDPVQKLPSFYNLWTRKESYLKAIGLGLDRDLHEVTVSASPDRPEVSSHWEFDAVQVIDQAGGGVWMATDIPIWNSYSAAVCYQGQRKPEIEVLVLDPERIAPTAI